MADSSEYTPETVQRRLAIAQQLLADPKKPITHWAEGLNELAKGAIGGYTLRKSEGDIREGNRRAGSTIADLLMGGGQSSQASPSMPMPGNTAASTQNKIYSPDEPSPLDPPSGKDRDMAIRTMYAEAGNQPEVGQQAVANVIRNRAVNGGYGGDTPSGVVTAKNQFEPWNTQGGRDRMASLSPDSPMYQQLARALDKAYTGDDPTNGATNFFAPKAQAALGRPVPLWGAKGGQDIGDHRFFGSPVSDQGALPPNAVQTQGQAPGQAPQNDPRALIAKALRSGDPYVMQAIRPLAQGLMQQQIEPSKLQKTGSDIMGNDVMEWVNPYTQKVAPLNRGDAQPQQVGGAPQSQNGPITFQSLGITPQDTGPALIDKVKAAHPALANRVQQLLNGEGGMPNARQNPIDKAAMVLAEQADPNWNLSVWNQKQDTMKDYSTKGKSGQSMENLAKIAKHMDDLRQSFTEQGNTDFPLVNAVKNTVGTAMGSEKTGNVNINITAVADEMASLMRREGMSDETIRQWRQNIGPNMSEEQQKGALRKMSQLVVDRMDPLAENYQRVMGKPIDLWSAFPSSKEKYEKTQAWANSTPGAAAKAAPAGAPKTGDVQQGYRFKGGNPADQNSWEKVQ